MTPLFRRFALLLALGASGQLRVVAADDASTASDTEYDAAPYRTNWRNIVPREIKFDVTAAATPAARTIGLREPPADPEVVTLPTFIVTRRRVEFQDLKRTLDNQAADAKVESTAHKLGIADHSFHSRHFGADLVTVFYIPVFVAFGWSW